MYQYWSSLALNMPGLACGVGLVHGQCLHSKNMQRYAYAYLMTLPVVFTLCPSITSPPSTPIPEKESEAAHEKPDNASSAPNRSRLYLRKK